MGNLLQDLRYGIRMLRNNPTISIIAVLAFAVGIGLTAATFSIVDGSVIRGLPFDKAEQLTHVAIGKRFEDAASGSVTISSRAVPVHDFLDWRERQTGFQELAAFDWITVNLAGTEGRPERYTGALVTANMFSVLGVSPVIGRWFEEADERPGSPRVVVIGHGVWQDRFGGRADIIGRTVRVNGEMMTIVAVAPPGFRFPFEQDVWIALQLDQHATPRGEGRTLDVFARLVDGVSRDEAASQLAGVARQLELEYPEVNEGVGVLVKPFAERFMPAEIVAVLFAMLGGVFGVFLIACANVANLLLARAAVRTREVAIRTALGAGRLRVVTQLLTETFVLTIVGALLGIVIAAVSIRLFNNALVDIQRPFWIDVKLDPTALLFTLVITLVASLIAGTVPAIQASGANVNDVLKDESRGATGFRMGRFSTALVIGEVAVSFALLVGAGLMIKSVVRLKNLDLGFSTENIITARLGLFQADYPDQESRHRFFRSLTDRLSNRPGVERVVLTSALPGAGTGRWSLGIEGRDYPADRDYPVSNRYAVSPDFFTTFGVSLLQGRGFDTRDEREGLPVAIVNQSFVRRHFGADDPVGRRVRFGRSESERPWRTIIGVVPDMHIGGGVGGIGSSSIQPDAIYVPLFQADNSFVSIAIRATGVPSVVGALMRDEVYGLDVNLPVYDLRSMEQVMTDATWSFGLFGSLFTILGVVAFLLAAVGLYGVMAFSVNRRTHEMGIRMAMGARGRDVIGLVLKRGAVQLSIGMALGLLGGMALGGPLQFVLYDVQAGDLSVYAGIVVTLGTAGLLASFLPARKAAKVDPVTVLRSE
jgi:predicted permease